MKRRAFLRTALSAAALGALGGSVRHASPSPPRPHLPTTPSAELPQPARADRAQGRQRRPQYAGSVHGSANYYALRPKIAIARDAVVQLSDRAGLHPSLAPLLPLWKERQLAVLQGVGYADPNLSHFRSIEIWDTASKPDEYLADGWLSRTFASTPVPRAFAADGVIIGSNDLGPLAGGGTRAVALANTEAFLRRAKLASPAGASRNKALMHILKVEADIVQAAAHLDARYAFRTEFPCDRFRQCDQDREPGDRQSGRRRGRARHAVGVRYAWRPAGDAGTAACRSGAGPRRAQLRARRARSLERHARADVRRVRPAPEGESVERHRPWHRERALSHSAAGSPADFMASRLRSTVSEATATRVTHSISAASMRRCSSMVEHAFGRHAGWPVRTRPVPLA